MSGQFEVDLALAELKLMGTRQGEERLAKLKKERLVLMIYYDENTQKTWAAFYNMAFNSEKPMWNAPCVEGEIMQFTIELDEMYDDKKRIYHCSYSTENGISELIIDPFYAHMSSESNSGQELVFICDRRNRDEK